MKAPNNIWLSKFEEDSGDNEYGIYEQWSLEPISNAENEEYIRKDKILETLESFSNPTTKLFVQSIIEKIESL